MQQADYLASQRAPDKAVILDEDIKRYIGIGNSTGLGMAPFLINHPLLINQWIEMRETALARVILASESGVDESIFVRLAASVQRVIQHLGEIVTADERQSSSNILVRQDLVLLHQWLQDETAVLVRENYDWANLVEYAERSFHLETQEVINTLLIELYPELVDDLEEHMGVDESIRVMPEMSVS